LKDRFLIFCCQKQQCKRDCNHISWSSDDMQRVSETVWVKLSNPSMVFHRNCTIHWWVNIFAISSSMYFIPHWQRKFLLCTAFGWHSSLSRKAECWTVVQFLTLSQAMRHELTIVNLKQINRQPFGVLWWQSPQLRSQEVLQTRWSLFFLSCSCGHHYARNLTIIAAKFI
jgi:hypothetical protein